MTDRELLKLAAKAAGYNMAKVLDGYPMYMEGYGIWNPLTDDGDALRLAVKLRMNVFHAAGKAYALDEEGEIECEQGHESDTLAATRRAIVRAAAEIGRGME